MPLNQAEPYSNTYKSPSGLNWISIALWKTSFGKNVTLKTGVYLIIEHTEALHVIDVNSGQRGKKKDKTQEENALEVNLEAAEEVARQLRLRDMGGIVVVDFIDLREASNRKLLFEKMKEFCLEWNKRKTGDRDRNGYMGCSGASYKKKCFDYGRY